MNYYVLKGHKNKAFFTFTFRNENLKLKMNLQFLSNPSCMKYEMFFYGKCDNAEIMYTVSREYIYSI